jgi:hypothetical protein
MSYMGLAPGPRMDARPFLRWLDETPRRLGDNDRRSLARVREQGTIDLYSADRIACSLGHPEMLAILYPLEPLPEDAALVPVDDLRFP